MTTANANADEIAELLGDHVDEAIVERIANLGATIDEIAEAVEDLDYQARFGEDQEPSSAKIAEIRAILEELPHYEDLLPETNQEQEDEHEGLTVVDDIEDLDREPQ